MLHRGRSKEPSTRKVTPPGPTYMSNEEFASYLANLRTNRIARPTGARPLPSSKTPVRRETDQELLPRSDTTAAVEDPAHDLPPRSTSALSSHPRSHSALSNYSTSSWRGRALVQPPIRGSHAKNSSPEIPILKPSEIVPTATYIERGQRWMEKEEACALRDALEDMDLTEQQKEEVRLHAAAQKEASELVWQHQHPQSVPNPNAPYKYKEHLRKNSYAHARTQSVGRDFTPRSISGRSSISDERRFSTDTSRTLSRTSNGESIDEARKSITSAEQVSSRPNHKVYKGLTNVPAGIVTGRRKSNGKRNISGEPVGRFTGEQIWEEPEEPELSEHSKPLDNGPEPLRIKPRNPLNRVQFAQDLPPRSSTTPPEVSKRLSRFEIHRNPPSQSRNPAYTANPPPPASAAFVQPNAPTKDGLEIRSDEIRFATSMKLKDRSPKLPTPVVVSDKPGRPIVSFDANWKPKEADVKPVEEPRRPRIDQLSHSLETKSLPALPTTKTFSTAPIPTIQLPKSPSAQGNNTRTVPTIICTPTNVPVINTPDAPRINISGPPSTTVSKTPVSTKSVRPLPDPKKMSSRPLPRHHATAPLPRGHWSPAVGSRATATCHQCDLPIEGRVVALRSLTQRWHPQCFACYICGTSLEALEISPEPDDRRAERLERIQARTRGELLEEKEGQTMAEDGDEKLRFYCHLDWHELFAPRCKHCTTPIIGEHVVALGEHWHYGHFFCAECGDPFEQGMTHIEKDGYAWCLACQTKRTERRAPKCKKCKCPVIGNYIQALGGEWHDDCFKCADCHGGFDDGKIFPIQTSTGVIVANCVKCMERKLKA